MRVNSLCITSNITQWKSGIIGFVLLCSGCNLNDEPTAWESLPRVGRSPLTQKTPSADSKMVLLESLTPQYAEEFEWPKSEQNCIATWEGKDRQIIPSHLRSSPLRSVDSHESSPATFEYVIIPGCRNIGARRAAIYERPLPFQQFNLPKNEQSYLLERKKSSPFFRRLESLWRTASLIADGPHPEIAAQSTIIHYARHNLFSLTFSVDTLEENFDTRLSSHTLFMDTGKDVRFLDLISEKAEDKVLNEINVRLKEQIEERNYQLMHGEIAGDRSARLIHQAQAGSAPCKDIDVNSCTPTRFFKKDLDHFIVHPRGLVFYHDFRLTHTADAQTPLAEVLLSFHFLKPYFKKEGLLGDWGEPLKKTVNRMHDTFSL